MTNKIIYPSILLLIVAAILIAPITHAQSSCPYIVSFNVTPTSGPVYITVAITGLPEGHEAYLHWGIEPYPGVLVRHYRYINDLEWDQLRSYHRAFPTGYLGCLGIP
ncbi:hypothetical protein [Vulcanisaeta souniana]|uniref:Uncharacterized protein n=1 Tax=Vulcanisaeta souniana JCM 11219 TaxID=1293586 RepID=A0ABM8BJR7_9CREN|nr:hypothetical protein [Vulcanisaeta souniana]BDR91229.1 hypothetical protein Vsou_03220 [Vulcanisaeta souniana JCM 11219]